MTVRTQGRDIHRMIEPAVGKTVDVMGLEVWGVSVLAGERRFLFA